MSSKWQDQTTPASIVAAGMRFDGTFEGQADLVVDGVVEGTIKCSALTVNEGGRVSGEIFADILSVKGHVSGKSEVRKLVLAKTGQMDAEVIVSETLAMEPGAVFEGNVRREAVAKTTKKKVKPEEEAEVEYKMAANA